MNWTLTSKEAALVHEFHLQKSGVEKMVIKINPLHESVRLQSGNSRRLVFLDHSPATSGKYLLCDEYGMEIGNMNFDKWYNNRGSVTIDSHKYFFQQQAGSNAALVVYTNDLQHPLLTCGLPTNAEPASFHEKASDTDNHCMMLALCWYLTLPSVTILEERMALQYS